MLELLNTQHAASAHNIGDKAQFRMRMMTNSRTAGSIPVWEKMTRGVSQSSTNKLQFNDALSANNAKLPAETILNNQNTPYQTDNIASVRTPETTQPDTYATKEESFGFGDIIDIINPLQHIPVVNHAYRSLTDDQIKPISEIVGGSIFGGATGGLTALANVLTKQATGKNITENITSLVLDQELPTLKQPSHLPLENTSDHPVDNLNNALTLYGDTNTLLSFADMSDPKHGQTPTIEKAPQNNSTGHLHNRQSRYND